jgi:hypothetical protein
LTSDVIGAGALAREGLQLLDAAVLQISAEADYLDCQVDEGIQLLFRALNAERGGVNTFFSGQPFEIFGALVPPESTIADATPSIFTESANFDLRVQGITFGGLKNASRVDHPKRSLLAPLIRLLTLALADAVTDSTESSARGVRIAAVILEFFLCLINPLNEPTEVGNVRDAQRRARRTGWIAELLSLEGVHTLTTALAFGMESSKEGSAVVGAAASRICDVFLRDDGILCAVAVAAENINKEVWDHAVTCAEGGRDEELCRDGVSCARMLASLHKLAYKGHKEAESLALAWLATTAPLFSIVAANDSQAQLPAALAGVTALDWALTFIGSQEPSEPRFVDSPFKDASANRAFAPRQQAPVWLRAALSFEQETAEAIRRSLVETPISGLAGRADGGSTATEGANTNGALTPALHLAKTRALARYRLLNDGSLSTHRTVVYVTAVLDLPNALEKLFAAGASPLTVDASGRSPLAGATGGFSLSCVEVVLRAVPSGDMTKLLACNNQGYSALHFLALAPAPFRTRAERKMTSQVVRPILDRLCSAAPNAVQLLRSRYRDFECDLLMALGAVVTAAPAEQNMALLVRDFRETGFFDTSARGLFAATVRARRTVAVRDPVAFATAAPLVEELITCRDSSLSLLLTGELGRLALRDIFVHGRFYPNLRNDFLVSFLVEKGIDVPEEDDSESRLWNFHVLRDYSPTGRLEGLDMPTPGPARAANQDGHFGSRPQTTEPSRD